MSRAEMIKITASLSWVVTILQSCVLCSAYGWSMIAIGLITVAPTIFRTLTMAVAAPPSMSVSTYCNALLGVTFVLIIRHRHSSHSWSTICGLLNWGRRLCRTWPRTRGGLLPLSFRSEINRYLSRGVPSCTENNVSAFVWLGCKILSEIHSISMARLPGGCKTDGKIEEFHWKLQSICHHDEHGWCSGPY